MEVPFCTSKSHGKAHLLFYSKGDLTLASGSPTYATSKGRRQAGTLPSLWPANELLLHWAGLYVWVYENKRDKVFSMDPIGTDGRKIWLNPANAGGCNEALWGGSSWSGPAGGEVSGNVMQSLNHEVLWRCQWGI